MQVKRRFIRRLWLLRNQEIIGSATPRLSSIEQVAEEDGANPLTPLNLGKRRFIRRLWLLRNQEIIGSATPHTPSYGVEGTEQAAGEGEGGQGTEQAAEEGEDIEYYFRRKHLVNVGKKYGGLRGGRHPLNTQLEYAEDDTRDDDDGKGGKHNNSHSETKILFFSR